MTWLVLSLMLFALPIAGPAQAQSDRAEELFQQGREAYESGDLERAYQLFQQSLALDSEPRTLLNLAVASERLGRLRDAVGYFERYLATSPPNSDRIRARMQRLRQSPGMVQIRTEPPGALVRLDGSDSVVAASPANMEVSPGRHTVRLTIDGYEPFVRELEVSYGETALLEVRLSRIPGQLRIVGDADLVEGDRVLGEPPLEIEEAGPERALTLRSTGSTLRMSVPIVPRETTSIDASLSGTGEHLVRVGLLVGASFARGSGGDERPPTHVQLAIDVEFAPACDRTCFLLRESLGWRPTGDSSSFLDAMLWVGLDQRLADAARLTLSTGAGIGHFFGVDTGERLDWWPQEAAVLGSGVHPMLGLDLGFYFRISEVLWVRFHPLTMRYAIVDIFPGGFLQFASTGGISFSL